MPRNVEIKARVWDTERLETLIYDLTESMGSLFVQEDTFFRLPEDSGRLKLRVINANPNGELIFYKRPNMTGPRMSSYSKSEVENAGSIKETLSKALGVLGSVKKHRRLYFYKNTRVHVDEVEGLGTFVELEAVLSDSETEEDGVRLVKELMTQLRIEEDHLIPVAYMDLKLNPQSPATTVPNGEVPQS